MNEKLKSLHCGCVSPLTSDIVVYTRLSRFSPDLIVIFCLVVFYLNQCKWFMLPDNIRLLHESRWMFLRCLSHKHWVTLNSKISSFEICTLPHYSFIVIFLNCLGFLHLWNQWKKTFSSFIKKYFSLKKVLTFKSKSNLFFICSYSKQWINRNVLFSMFMELKFRSSHFTVKLWMHVI